MKTLQNIALILWCGLAGAAMAAEPQMTLDVWPGKAPGETGQIGEEVMQQNKPGEKPFKRVTNVSKPQIEFFPAPKDKNTGVAIIVCPGGGYNYLMMDYEGPDIAVWL